MTRYVLVHGGFQGGWSFRRVATMLREAGHEVYTPTLTGLGERSHLAGQPINLDTHITDIVNTIVWEDLSEVVLLGHSYVGMVITGVADRIPERVATLVYLDALVPEDGDTLFTLRPEYLDYFLSQVAAGGGLMVPQSPASAFDTALPQDWAWIDSKTTPHPFACFIQPIRLSGRQSAVPRRIFVHAQGGICDAMYQPFKTRPGAKVIAVADSGHSIMINQPARLAEILLEAGQP